MRTEFLSKTELYRQSKLYANCQFYSTIVVLTEMAFALASTTEYANFIPLSKKYAYTYKKLLFALCL